RAPRATLFPYTTLFRSRDVPEWDQYFMNMAAAAAGRSKDPSTQCGAVLVDGRRRVVSTGFNGGCSRIPDHRVDWSRPNKYAWVRSEEHTSELQSPCNLV